MQIDPEDLPREISGNTPLPDIGREMPLKEYLEEQEISIIKSAIRKFGSARKAAAALKINHSTITRKLQKYDKSPVKT